MTAPLFDLPPKLTENQQLAYDYITGEGKTVRDVGIHVHLNRENPCRWCVLSGGSGCNFAEAGGQQVLGALRKKGLVVRRRSGIWQHVGAKIVRPTSQTTTFPDGY